MDASNHGRIIFNRPNLISRTPCLGRLVSEAPNVVAGKLNSVLPLPLLVRNRRSVWLTLMVLRFGPSPCLICPPSSPLPKALKPMEISADLSPYLLRPRFGFISLLHSPISLKLSSFRDCSGRSPVMVMMDLAWFSCYLSQNLVASSYRLVRLFLCWSLILNRLEVVPLWNPRELLPMSIIADLLSSFLPSEPSISVLAGYGRHTNRVMICLDLNDRYFCRDQLLSLLWTLSETRLPNRRLSSFRVKSTGIMTLSLRSRCYRSSFNSQPTYSPIIEFSHVLIYCLDNLQPSVCLGKYGDHVFERWLPSLFQPR